MGQNSVNCGHGRVWEAAEWRLQMWAGLGDDGGTPPAAHHNCFDIGAEATGADYAKWQAVVDAADEGQAAFIQAIKDEYGGTGAGSGWEWFDAQTANVQGKLFYCSEATGTRCA